jgi:signal transduction histidine kinase
LLLETELDGRQRQYAEGVQGAGEALLSVINDILDFSKLEAGKVVLDPTSFDPRRLVDEVGALLAPAAASKGLELITYCLPEVPSAVHGDPGRIRQILLNLASNAVKFTPEGEVAVRGRSYPTDDGGVLLRFDVTDTGIGIAEKDQRRLFESFSQADASTTRRFGGTGLGLAISRRLVEVMGGDIGLESSVGGRQPVLVRDPPSARHSGRGTGLAGAAARPAERSARTGGGRQRHQPDDPGGAAPLLADGA